MERYTQGKIPEPDGGSRWCPLIQTYILGGEPFCSFGGGEYPYVGKDAYPCGSNYFTCKYYKVKEV